MSDEEKKIKAKGDTVHGDRVAGDKYTAGRDITINKYYGPEKPAQEVPSFPMAMDERIPVAPLSTRVGIENFIRLYLGSEDCQYRIKMGSCANFVLAHKSNQVENRHF